MRLALLLGSLEQSEPLEGAATSRDRTTAVHIRPPGTSRDLLPCVHRAMDGAADTSKNFRTHIRCVRTVQDGYILSSDHGFTGGGSDAEALQHS